jgi:hypothetical protein
MLRYKLKMTRPASISQIIIAEEGGNYIYAVFSGG